LKFSVFREEEVPDHLLTAMGFLPAHGLATQVIPLPQARQGIGGRRGHDFLGIACHQTSPHGIFRCRAEFEMICIQ